MKYTVIVPVYNGEDTIANCLESIVGQKDVENGKDYTVMVVDDGSTDNTARIAEKFPVELIRLPGNEGRIIARLTGAKRAKTGRILFVDSRVTLPPDTIAKLDRFDGNPAVIGEINSEENKYGSIWHTILYLIRRRYYGKDFFPMKTDELWITRDNFRRAPKGTAVLLIDRDLFVALTPERTGRDVNDDTLLFKNLVFGEKVDLLRSRDLFYRYSQRTSPGQFSGWLFHRGVRFSDFYLRPGGYFFIPFLALAAILSVGALTAVVSLIGNPAALFSILLAACALNALIALYLAENRRDFIPAFLGLPPLLAIFGSGVVAFWIRQFRSRWGKR